jgi:CheY-like chemotaxis protein
MYALVMATVRPLVLIVDDHAINRKLLGAAARKLGFTPIEAENGAQALALCAQQPQEDIAYVLLDLQMPVLDGWSTAKEMRSTACSLPNNVPIIACTGCDLQEQSQQSQGQSIEEHTLACGVDMCLNKPLSLAQLTAALQQLAVPCPASDSHACTSPINKKVACF